jgi:hypothetical protein
VNASKVAFKDGPEAQDRRSSFIDGSELTTVYYCPTGTTVRPTGGHNYDCLATDGTTLVAAVEFNVFNSVFDQYFWDINNYGVRVMQMLMRANF